MRPTLHLTIAKRIFSFFLVLIPVLGLGQFTMNGSTLNSGSYTCGVSTFSEPSTTVDETNYSITICPSASEVAVISLGTIQLNNAGGTGSDDVLTITQGGTTLYTDGPSSNGVDNITISGTVAGACLTVTLAVHGGAGSPGFADINGLIRCLPAANAGPDQYPGNCSTSTTLSANSVSPATGTWSVVPAAGVTFSNINDPNATVSGMTAGTQYTFTWTSSQGAASHSDAMIFNSVGPGCQTYCNPAPGYSLNTVGYISNVNINSGAVNQTSGWIGGLNNYTGSCATVTQGLSYPLSITFTHNTANTTYYNYWIDWDADGVFESNEVTSLGSGTVTQTFTPTFTVPCNSAVGNIRMRVVIQYNSNPTDPCVTNTQYGETEDYCLSIVAATTPVASAGLDQTISCTSLASINASASTPAPANGYWTLVSGTGEITSSTNPNTTVTGLSNGANIFQWTEVGTCANSTDEVTINVSGLPDEPVSAGDDIFTCTQGLALNGSDPTPFTGQWVVVSGPNTPTFSPNVNDPNAQVSGMINGVYVLAWQVNAGACGIISDQMTFNFGSLPSPNAGPDQTICPTGTVLNGNDFSGAIGTWSVFSGPAGSGFVDVNDPNTTVYGLVAGTYVLRWTVSGGGCAGGTFDAVSITVNACTTAVTQSTTSNQTFTGCQYTFTDNGGSGGNYANGIAQTWTTFCPDDPNDFATLTLTAANFYSGDYITIYDSPAPAAPIIASYWYDPSPGGGMVYNPPLGSTITSSTGCLYVQMNSTATNATSGWTSTVGCSSTAGTQSQQFVTVNNCGGGGGVTLCGNGSIPAIAGSTTNPPDLGGANSGCLGSQEGASNTWVYMTAETDGYIAFEISPAGGQDFDYAIWGPYDGGYACPGNTLDDPIRCSWAANGGAGCPAEIGLGIIDATGGSVLPGDVSETGTCTATNEGWTYPILANAGDVYVLLFQNYGYNNSSFDVTINSDPNAIPPGGTYASLGCLPPQPLPIELISFVGEHKDRVNKLYWNCASESNNDYFTIERSSDGENWSFLASVDAAGYSQSLTHYSTIDPYPLMGINYYRLSQTDFDGTKRKYKTIALSTEVEIENLFSDVYPNPTDNSFYFNYGGKDFTNIIEVNVFNAAGQLMTSETFDNFNSTQSMEIETIDLPTGIYYVYITQNEKREIKKISIIK